MTSKLIKFSKMTKKKKIQTAVLLFFFGIIIITGIKASYAYYHNDESYPILSSLVGDFESNNGDINMVIYKQTDEGKYVRVNYVPTVGYTLNETSISCTKTCTNNSSSSCYYTYTDIPRNLTLTSSEKVTCKFYFDKTAESDINVYVLIEDENGSYTNSNNSKKYSISENIPVYGYVYVDSTCDSAYDSIRYIPETKKFNVKTSAKNNCYAYFDSTGNSDITTNVYVQTSTGNTEYKSVSTIPSGKLYKISEKMTSHCYVNNVDTESVISYEDGYINITNTDEKQICDVYLDLQ